VLVLTGTDPAFSAGLDLRELGDSGGNMGVASGDRGPFPERTKPLIGAVNGVAVTGGFELALCCDFLIASEHARFADTHARVGVMPGWGLSVLLPQAVGVRRAREMSLSGNYIDAGTAEAWGLVNRVVPHDELIPTVRALATDIIGNDQPGVRQILRTYERTSSVTIDEAWTVEREMGRSWLRDSGFTPERVAERRAAIQSRGRDQKG
jgi:enoyl-CoA hydratase